MEISPGIHRIVTDLGERSCAVYLLVGQRYSVLVDSGMKEAAQDTILPYLASVGVPASSLRLVLFSHADFDHMAGGAALRAALPNALFACHPLERAEAQDVEVLIERLNGFGADHGIWEPDSALAWIRAHTDPTTIDLTLIGGETLDLGGLSFEVLHLPGHTRGHLALYEPERRVAIVIDAVLERAVYDAAGRVAFPPTYRHAGEYLETIARLRALPTELLLTSHYPVMRGEAAATFLKDSHEYAVKVEAALLDALHASSVPLTLKELIACVGPGLGEWPPGAEIYLDYPLLGHLERLERLGTVQSVRQGGLLAYRESP
ncbi:MBL fold metallo-hydrolase [Deinococcus sp.]|uniref:MBL fold metallo-hydrolase n=1 Tax=Deinococcus sp. TaxID=47478 RepID=UPI003CC6657D